MNDWNSAALSLRQSETVRGYEIRRLPLGEYLRALHARRPAPRTLLAASQDHRRQAYRTTRRGSTTCRCSHSTNRPA